jgi:hypothetical protein
MKNYQQSVLLTKLNNQENKINNNNNNDKSKLNKKYILSNASSGDRHVQNDLFTPPSRCLISLSTFSI